MSMSNGNGNGNANSNGEGDGKLRAAVIGVGHLGQHHARVLAGMPGVELVGVADAQPEQARKIADKFGGRPYVDYADLLDKVDAVSIAAPTKFHHEIGMAFLSRGVHCMMEKPLASTLSQAEALANAAKAHRAVLQVGHIERFNPALSALADFQVRPKYISCERMGTYTFRSTDIGVVLDLMIHDIDLVLSMVKSPVKSVSAVGVKVMGAHEDVANARVEFANGCVAALTASRVSYQTVRKMRLWGTEGYATLDFADKQSTLIRVPEDFKRGQAIALDGVDLSRPDAARDFLFGRLLRMEQCQGQGPEPLALELSEFVNAIRFGIRPTVTGEEAVEAMRLADKVLVSIDSHQWEPAVEGLAGPKFWTRPRSVRGSVENEAS